MANVKAQCVKYVEEYPKTIDFIKHIITALVAFALGYFALRSQVSQLRQDVSELQASVVQSGTLITLVRQTLNELMPQLNALTMTSAGLNAAVVQTAQELVGIEYTMSNLNIDSACRL